MSGETTDVGEAASTTPKTSVSAQRATTTKSTSKIPKVEFKPLVSTHDPNPSEEEVQAHIEALWQRYKDQLLARGITRTYVNAIITCESDFRPSVINQNYLENGTVWSTDKGIFQVNDYYHKRPMLALGLTFSQWEDTAEYGFMLLASNGTKPWKASRHCWLPMVQ